MKAKEKLDAYNKKLADLQLEEDNLFQELILEVLKEPDVKRVIFIGHTPSFNDGDPCEHSENVYFNLTEDDLYIRDDYDSNEDFYEDYPHLKDLQHISAEKDIELSNYFKDSQYHARKYGTDYKVIYTLQDGEVHVEYEDYDCGY